jgi:FlaG/FlaF family flagellin (archaellin)
VLNLGGDLQSAPQAQLSVEVNDNADGVILTHNGGDALNVDDLRIAGDLEEGPFTDLPDYSSGDQFSVGDEADLGGDAGTEYTVRIIHEPSESILVEGTVSVPS